MSFFAPDAGRGKRALLLSAHTDDCEIGMGGTIARLIEAGYTIRWLTFCNAWQSLPDGFAQDTLVREQRAAVRSYGIDESALQMHDIPVRQFPAHRQDILEALVAEARAYPPDLVFCPSLQDRHQDHLTLAQEAERAFKRKTLFGYILPWNVSYEMRDAHVALHDRHVAQKLAALACYESQSHRPYFKGDAHEVLLKANGLRSGHDMAEAFEVIAINEKL